MYVDCLLRCCPVHLHCFNKTRPVSCLPQPHGMVLQELSEQPTEPTVASEKSSISIPTAGIPFFTIGPQLQTGPRSGFSTISADVQEKQQEASIIRPTQIPKLTASSHLTPLVHSAAWNWCCYPP